MKRFIDYNTKLKERTKELQKAMTVPEKSCGLISLKI
jgi:hypothetical protein